MVMAYEGPICPTDFIICVISALQLQPNFHNTIYYDIQS